MSICHIYQSECSHDTTKLLNLSNISSSEKNCLEKSTYHHYKTNIIHSLGSIDLRIDT